jgi:decaprenylphospho-beta-D-ribofuranose 2-oxidase
MTGWKPMTVTGWGRSSTAAVEACRPERIAEAHRALGQVGGEGIIAHGSGRSYGDAALNDGGRVMLTRRLDRVLAFDPSTGDLAVEPGVTFADLLKIFLPRGFLVPVTPGTAFATLGGAVANDVHGKNHDRTGGFGDHVQWLDLLLPSGEELRVSPSERPDLFAATIGGIGLTGIILAVALRLQRVPSPAVTVAERRIGDLDGFLAAFAEHRATATYSVGWIDALARGRSLGRGILELAEPAQTAGAAAPAKARTRRVPVDLPGFVLNPASVALFNEAYYRRVPAAGRERLLPYEKFLYPLDAIRDWNRIYGRRGFYQFQCVLPDEAAPRGLRALLEAISAARGASFLAVLKTLGGEGRGHLSFPLRGHTLALDFPRGAGTDELMARLERLTLDHGGRIYLAKDACLSAAGFAAMYPKLDVFRAVLREIDPQGRMTSGMARRLNIRGGAS